MGTEKRVEPGTENKIKLSVPGPTRYQLPSLVRRHLIHSIYILDLRGTKNISKPTNLRFREQV